MKVKVNVVNRRFPHDDVAVYLPGATPPANSTFEEVEFADDQEFADGTLGVCVLGRGCVTVIGPTDGGGQKAYDEYDTGRYFSKFYLKNEK